MGWGGLWEGGSGWGTHVHPWLIHVHVWQKPPQYCKVISLQLKELNKFLKEIRKILSFTIVSKRTNYLVISLTKSVKHCTLKAIYKTLLKETEEDTNGKTSHS